MGNEKLMKLKSQSANSWARPSHRARFADKEFSGHNCVDDQLSIDSSAV
jgi:hypothetical protein